MKRFDHGEQKFVSANLLLFAEDRKHTRMGHAGIFAEKGSGLSLWQRTGFMRMMELARNGKIDLIFTESKSRFGRNTVDMLQVALELCGCGVDVFFEKESIWLHDCQMQILLTAYMSYAQVESESASQNIRGYQ